MLDSAAWLRSLGTNDGYYDGEDALKKVFECLCIYINTQTHTQIYCNLMYGVSTLTCIYLFIPCYCGPLG